MSRIAAIRPLCLALMVLAIAWGASSPSPATAQPDSTRRAILRAKGLPADHTPKKALWRALAFPGWGQYYNRQYLKIPMVWAGLGGFTAGIIYTNNQYLLFRHAALYKLAEEEAGSNADPADNPYQRFRDEYLAVRNRFGGEISSNVLRQQRDRYRRYRDLSVIGLGLYYALSVLDAYVSAHLLTFDVSENLSARVHPTVPRAAAPPGVTATLQLRF